MIHLWNTTIKAICGEGLPQSTHKTQIKTTNLVFLTPLKLASITE